MAEPENTEKVPDPVVKTPDPSEEMIGGKKFSELDPATQAHFVSLREADKAKRLKLEELSSKLAAIEADKEKQANEAKAAAEKLLQEQGDFKKLYEAATPQLQELKTVKAAVKEYEAFVDQSLEAAIKAIPENKRSLVEALPPMSALAKLKWINANSSILSTPVAPELNPGTVAANNGQVVDPQAVTEWRKQYNGF